MVLDNAAAKRVQQKNMYVGRKPCSTDRSDISLNYAAFYNIV